MLANLQEIQIRAREKCIIMRKFEKKIFHLCCMIDDDIELHPWKKTDLSAIGNMCDR